jgi:3-hydroxyacyl-CoA dehydrogenase
MIPCWGSTQRLPHLIGLENSMQMLVGNHRYHAQDAYDCGLVDELAEPGSEEPPTLLGHARKRDWTAFPTRNWRETWLESNRPGRWFLFRGTDRVVRTRIPEAMPAPAELLHALKLVYESPTMQPGLDYEREAMARVASQPALKHLLRLLQHREKLKAAAPLLYEKARIHEVGIIGTNVAGIALLLHSLMKGYSVVLRGEDEHELGGGLAQIVKLLQAEVRNGSMTAEHYQKLLAGVRGTYTWMHFDKLDLVVDTTQGQLDDKLAFYKDLEQRIPKDALIVAMTSYHVIDELRQGLQRPHQMIGLQLIEPWARASLAEIAVPAKVAPTNVQRVRDWATQIGKYCLQIPDCVGGLATRIWLPALNEAGLLVKEGVPIDRIDHAMRRFGMTFGPLEMMDRMGIDHVASLISVMAPTYAGRIKFETGFAIMAERDWVGKRTALGFYRLNWRRPKPFRAAAILWKKESLGELPHPVPALSEADSHAWIQHRLVTLMSLEAQRCLDEGLAKSADDIDCAMCLTGWATHRGGPLGYARDVGDAFTEVCAELAKQYGARYACEPALQPVKKDG